MEIEFRVHFSPHLVGIGAEKQSMLDSLVFTAVYTCRGNMDVVDDHKGGNHERISRA
jgi:hypothetical protein